MLSSILPFIYNLIERLSKIFQKKNVDQRTKHRNKKTLRREIHYETTIQEIWTLNI
jgi:hypothetical protein